MNIQDRYFSFAQLGQSLAITGGVGFLLVGIGLLIAHPPLQSAQVPLPLATTTAAATIEQSSSAFSAVNIIGQSAIVFDIATGKVLYSENADAQLPLASLTKLLSVYAADGVLAAQTPVTVGSSSVAQEGDSGIVAGETFSYAALAKLALVASSNDAADAITLAASEKRATDPTRFLASAASAAGLTKTYAVNGTGLDVDMVRSGGYGTARDVATLASEFVASAPDLAAATTEPRVTVRSLAGVAHMLPNTNPDAERVPGLMLSKTGFTDLAGGNLVIVYNAGINHPVAIVVLGSSKEGRFTDVATLTKATQTYLAEQAANSTS